MSFIGLLLLIFIIWAIVVPLAKFGIGLYRARRNWKDAMDRFRQAAGYGPGQGPADPRAPRARGVKKKKIGRDTGEYVAFEEIASGERRSSSQVPETTVTEEQITDVSWEDIK